MGLRRGEPGRALVDGGGDGLIINYGTDWARTQVHGDLAVHGTLSKGAGSFKIDHPLDPENKYLYHSFVESPDMKNIYDGTVRLDKSGEATISLPSYFEALNRDFRYQLTCVGDYAPVFIKQKVRGNRFVIAGGKPGLEVSWQVTGIRQDMYAKEHPIVPEVVKPKEEQGTRLYSLNHKGDSR